MEGFKRKVSNIEFVATTTEGKKINVVYTGKFTRRSRISQRVLQTLQEEHDIHPGRIEELRIITPQ